MSKFELNLKPWDVEIVVPEPTEKDPHRMAPKTVAYPAQQNLSVWLRSVGIFRTAEDIAEAVSLAKDILKSDRDIITLDDREADVLKKCVNKQVELTADGLANVGGPTHEEMICRVVEMKEVK